MRRSLLALLALATSLVACGGDESPGIPPRSPKTNDTGAVTPGGETGSGTPTTTASCAGVADAKQISTDVDAADLQIADGAVFFRVGTKVIRAAKDGSGKVPVYESPSLVRSFVGGGVVLTIEDPTPPNAVVHVVSMEEQQGVDPAGLGVQIATAWNAGGSYFVGADADAFYAVGDEQQGEVIYKLAKALPVLQPLATVTDVVSSAQIAAGGLWYVRDRTRVFSIPLGTLDPNSPDLKIEGEPKEVFGSTATSCALAVGQDATFCSAGAFVERRDLTGANPKTLLEANKSKVAAPFGSAKWFDGTLYVRTSAPDATVGHAVRALKASATGVEERVVACGRSAIGEVAVDADSVVWTEPGKGVFMAPR